MIQIATLGDTQVVVEEGLRKNPPEKLYILYTENERTKSQFDEDLKKAKGKDKDQIKTQQYKDNAEKLKKKIVNEIPIKKPKYTIFFAISFPKDLLARSVIKNAIG